MKKPIAFAAVLAASVTCWGQLADMIQLPDAEPQVEPQTPVPAPTANFTDAELLQTWGWLLADRFNLGGFDFTDEELEQIHKGIVNYVHGEHPPTDLNTSMQVMQQYFVDREQKAIETAKRRHEELKKLNMAKELDFFDTLFGQPGVQSLGSGLSYQILREGTGPHPKPRDTVVVNYEGRLLDNTVFDSTSGRNPVSFKLNEVIEGWTQGLPLIGVGGKIKLYVPYKLGYGEEGNGGAIPPAATLVFEIELLKIVDPAEAAATPAAPEAPEAPAATAAE